MQIGRAAVRAIFPPTDWWAKREIPLGVLSGGVGVDLALDDSAVVEHDGTMNLALLPSLPKHCPPNGIVRDGWREPPVVPGGAGKGDSE